jgi:hypothetical protein
MLCTPNLSPDAITSVAISDVDDTRSNTCNGAAQQQSHDVPHAHLRERVHQLSFTVYSATISLFANLSTWS